MLRQAARSYSQKVLREVQIVKRISQQDLDNFSQITGDFNPVHSIATPLEERRVQGALLNSLVAGVLGTQLPGPGTIVLEQQFKFPNACRIDKETTIKVKLLQERKISLAAYEVRQGDTIVLEGTAKLLTKQK